MPINTTDWKTPANMLASLADSELEQLTLATNLFIGHLPADPNNCVAFFDYGGQDPSDSLAINQNHIQVWVRNESYEDGYKLCEAIKVALQSMAGYVIEGEKLVGVWVVSNPTFIGRDANECSEFSCNLRVIFDTNKNLHRMPDSYEYVLDGGNPSSVY